MTDLPEHLRHARRAQIWPEGLPHWDQVEEEALFRTWWDSLPPDQRSARAAWANGKERAFAAWEPVKADLQRQVKLREFDVDWFRKAAAAAQERVKELEQQIADGTE